MASVLFVCTANICRSPMVMALFRDKLAEDYEGWRVESAGTWAPEGTPAAYNTQIVLAERGLDISEHSSRPVDLRLLSSFNLILTMEAGHKEAIQAEFPRVADRVFMLTEMVGMSYDIRDPIGGPLQNFERTVKEFERILDQGFERIIELAQD